MAIILRSTKGSNLEPAEVDGNFTDLDGRITTNASALGSKQNTLVSNTNIKTVNGVSILGAGDVTTGNSFFPNYKTVGTIYSKSSWTDLLDFITRGATVASNGTKIDLSGGAGTFDKSVGFGNPTQHDKWRIKTIFKISSAIGSTTYGIGIGKRSINTNPFNILGRIDISSNTTRGNIIISNNSGDVATGATPLTINQNDIIELIMERDAYVITFRARNITTNSAAITLSYTFSLAYGALVFLDNTGRFSLYALGGTQTIQSIETSSSELTNPLLCVVGDSKMQGYYQPDQNDRLGILLNKYITPSTINSGGNDRTIEVLARINEIITLNPKKVLLTIGSNDIRYSRTLTDVQTDYASIVTQLTNAGIIVYHCVIPETILVPFESFIRTTYGNYYIPQVWDSLSNSSGAILSIYDPGDGVHINSAGVKEMLYQIRITNKLN